MGLQRTDARRRFDKSHRQGQNAFYFLQTIEPNAMALIQNPMQRDLMAPGTEPTDEELQIVMREAHDLVRERKAQSDLWMREQLAQAVQAVQRQSLAPRST